MARMLRVHIEGALFYVTSRGDNNADIFKEDEDYKTYIELLKKYKAQYGFKLFAFCLLPNHLHLLIELKGGITLSDIMHDLNSNYTKYFNGKYQRKGHLFQERYKMAVVEKTPYILRLGAYIHLNPVLLGLVENLGDYPYSSYHAFTGSRAAWVAMDGEIRELGIKDYANFLAGIPKQDTEGLRKELSKNTILGSDGFVERVRQLTAELERSERKVESAQHRRLIYISAAGAAILLMLTLYLYGRAAVLRKWFKDEMAKKNIELNARLLEERKKIVKDLEEKYAADRVSFEAMARRLELEKKKLKGLEEGARAGK